MEWTASSDQPWLSWNENSGATPVMLTVTANNATFSASEVYTATVSIIGETGGGQQSQTVVLPVHVAIGNVVSNAISTPARTVFLPLIRR